MPVEDHADVPHELPPQLGDVDRIGLERDQAVLGRRAGTGQLGELAREVGARINPELPGDLPELEP